jgi:hypothetical protein
MIQKLRDDFATDAGMLCIWNPSAFGMIDDYDSWEKELLEDSDIIRHIKSGNLVPVNIGSDGCWGIEVRVGTSGAPEVLTDRESKYVVVSSEPYLLVSNGSLCISGLEHVHGQPGDSVGVFKVPKGQYAVTVQLIGWDDEPGMKDKKGNPKKDALQDFVILVNSTSAGSGKYRTKVETFPPPPE